MPKTNGNQPGTKRTSLTKTQTLALFQLRNKSNLQTLSPNDPESGIDWGLFKEIMDHRELLWPNSKRKRLFALCHLSFFCAFFLMERYFEILKKINMAFHERMLWLTIITYGLEPFMLLLNIVFARYPHALVTAGGEDVASPQERNSDAVLVIPCHDSAHGDLEQESLRKVIRAALRHFSPSHIIVVDNGKPIAPSDNTKEVIHEIDKGIIYLYRGADGNKTRAQLHGVSFAIQTYGSMIKYVLLIDDDVQIPINYAIEHSFFLDKNVKGIIYPIRATSTSSDNKDPLLVRWQDIEYQLSDLTLCAQDASHSALAPHGACVLLNITTAKLILQEHTGRFHGEDKEIGAILRNMYDIQGPLKFRYDQGNPFRTVVPMSYFGYGGNLWKQRVRSWSLAPFLYWWSLVLKPLLADWRAPIASLPMTKLTQGYYFLSQCSHIFRYYIIVLEAKNPKFWMAYSIFSLLQLSMILLFNYQKLPPYLQNDFVSVVSFPVYKSIDNAMSHFAFWRAIFYAIPNEGPAKSSLQRIESKEVPNLPNMTQGEYRVLSSNNGLETQEQEQVRDLNRMIYAFPRASSGAFELDDSQSEDDVSRSPKGKMPENFSHSHEYDRKEDEQKDLRIGKTKITQYKHDKIKFFGLFEDNDASLLLADSKIAKKWSSK